MSFLEMTSSDEVAASPLLSSQSLGNVGQIRSVNVRFLWPRWLGIVLDVYTSWLCPHIVKTLVEIFFIQCLGQLGFFLQSGRHLAVSEGVSTLRKLRRNGNLEDIRVTLQS